VLVADVVGSATVAAAAAAAAGMMRFSRGFMLFADKLPVVPVALRVKGAFPQLHTHTLDSNFLVNLFWCSFQPWTVMEVRALPATSLAPGESKAAFVQRVQLAIAEELHVWVADINIQQKRQLAGGQPRKQAKQRSQ
jgi:hypothetical protein